MKKILIIIIVVCVSGLWSNSVFAPHGYPLAPTNSDVYGIGMGESSIADMNRVNLNTDNPSLLVSARNVTLSTAIRMGYYWYKDSSDKFRDDGIHLPYFTLSVPIKFHRLGISLTNMYSGDIDTGAENQVTKGNETIDYEEINRKSGNIYRMGLHYAAKTPYINLGVSAFYYQGNSIRYWSLDFDDTSYTDSKYEIEKGFSGFNWNLGLNRSFGDLCLGISYEPGKKLEGDYYYKFNYNPGTDTLSTSDDLFELPSTFNAGLSYMITSTMKTNLDMRYRLWESTEIEYTNNFTGEIEEYENSWRIAAGFSYDPLAGIGKWYQNIPFRTGLSWYRLPFKSKSENIDEYSVSMGSSLQLNSPGRKIDFALSYTVRQSENSDELSDESLELSIGLTGIDIFRKRVKRIEDREIPKVEPGMEIREDRI